MTDDTSPPEETAAAPPADVAGMLEAFAHEDDRLPREAIAFARANWDVAGLALLGVLEDFAQRRDRSDRAYDCAFYATLLMMTQRDSRGFAPLARIARETDTMFEILGDSAGDLLPGVLSATFDGDIDRLWSIVEAAHADDEARAAALDAYAWLVLSKRIPMEDAEPRFTQAFARLEPKEPAPVWLDLAMTAATLGLSNLLPLVRSACRKGYIPAKAIRMRELEEEFAVGRSDFFRRSAQFVRDNAPQDDIFEEMERWAAAPDDDAEEGEGDGAWNDDAEPDQDGPAVNPTRGVGRNDPCPCGSGKKFKKCCLAA